MAYSPFGGAGLAAVMQPRFIAPSAPAGAPNPDPRTQYGGGISSPLQQGNTLAQPDPRNSLNFNSSQLGSHPAGQFSGYYPNPGTQNPNSINGAVGGQTGPLPNVMQWTNPHTVTAASMANPILPQAQGAPHAHEPLGGNAPPEMGQWGGGAWNVGSGAPASAQPMWLGSFNNGTTWSQQPGQNAGAPKPGMTNSQWGMAKNQDPDSPTWVQGGR